MSLRLRLVLMIGTALALLWSSAALWMLRDLDSSLQHTLDERLAMSARMVSGLLAQAQLATESSANAATGPAIRALSVRGSRRIACQVRSLRGEVIATTAGVPGTLLRADAPGYRTKVLDGVRWRTYTLHAHGLSITTADSGDERAALGRRIALAAGVPFLIAVLGGLLALWLGANRGLAPLGELSRTLVRRRAEDSEPLNARALPAEIRPLVDSLNRLLRRIASTVRRERDFTNHAAHELRTPLTAIDTHLQVARLTTGEQARRALDDAGVGVRRMRAILEQLLLLARIEGRQSFEEGESLTVARAVDRVLEGLPADAAGRIVRGGATAEAVIAVPPELAVAALRNLIDNALRYSPAERPVEISTDLAGKFVRLRVVDHGSGFAPEDRARATQPFWRGRVVSGAGSGLGLAIVAAIAGRYGGRITLQPSDDGGTVADLLLPRSPPGP